MGCQDRSSNAMPTRQTQLTTSHVGRRPVQRTDVHTPLLRQWKLLELLSSAPDGVTVLELTEATGRSDKTVRRDLILLRKVGFDLKETVGPYGRKSWRVGQRFERLRSPRKRYKTILSTLDALVMQVSLAGDRRLVGELQAIRRRVVRKCR
jgi:predicted DNA-binding transcriptional regulator YafY